MQVPRWPGIHGDDGASWLAIGAPGWAAAAGDRAEAGSVVVIAGADLGTATGPEHGLRDTHGVLPGDRLGLGLAGL